MREVLPIDESIPQIVETVLDNAVTVLRAAPGTGKTTRVAPALHSLLSGKILLVEPRRVAASGAASRIAYELGEKCGKTAGFIVRGEKSCSKESSIIAVTTGIFLNMLLHDPSLDGVSAVIFDEFHERSMQSDLGFTLTLESMRIFRDDLKIVIMSATIDANKLLEMVPEAKIADVPGKLYELTTQYNSDGIVLRDLIPVCARHTMQAVKEYPGDALVFMPGAVEIDRLADALKEFASEQDIEICKLHGRMKFEEQSAVLNPSCRARRRIVIATNIAESSVTIPHIRIVIDSGYEKRLLHDPSTGFDRLETCRISLESADQRAGRAARTASGYVKRLWSMSDERSFERHTPAEISGCDLAPLALALADWGAAPDELIWMTPPDSARLAAAQELLKELGAADAENRITERGKEMSRLPVHPRISAMLTGAAGDPSMLALGCETAAVIEEPAPHENSVLISQHIELLRRHPDKFRRRKELANQLKKLTGAVDVSAAAPEFCSQLVMRAFPDRVGGFSGRMYRFSGGGSGVPAPDCDLQSSPVLACAALQGSINASCVIRLCEYTSLEEIREIFSDRITSSVVSHFDPSDGKVTSVREERLGELVLNSTPCASDPQESAKAVVSEALRRGIAIPDPSDKKAVQFLERVLYARRQLEEEFPHWEEPEVWKDFLLENAAFAGNIRDFNSLRSADWLNVMKNAAGYQNTVLLDRLYPEYFVTPANCRHAIDYSGDVPVLRARVQEMYGVKSHPCVGKKNIPLKIDLLSPALRSTQITSDLPGFWKNSWHLVRKDMKSRYPKHDWPEDPENATPHTKVRL